MPRPYIPAVLAIAALLAAAPSATPAQSRASASAGGARAVSEKNPLYEFSYAYPAAAGALPRLHALIERDLAATRARLAKESRADRQGARTSGYPYHAHYSATKWQVVADLPDWLSLSATIATYTGGAHGMSVFDTLLWDRRAGVRRAPIDLFVSKAALRSAVRAPFCAALNRERAKKRGANPIQGAMFNDCIDPLDQVVILGSAGRQRFDRIGFLVAPYNAGPYAEGSYEVTLPLTPALLRAVRPRYRAAFAAS